MRYVLADFLHEIGDPAHFRVGQAYFEWLMGKRAGYYDDCDGAAAIRGSKIVQPVWFRHKGTKGRRAYGTDVHENVHLVEPGWPEWFVTGAAYKLAHRRGGLGLTESMCGHSLDEIPDRDELVKRLRRKVEKGKKK